VIAASAERLRALLDDDALVLDVGGWASPISRADWVADLLPYGTRGLYGDPDADPERFDATTWVELDICAAEPWPFADNQFDFAICSHTLEDVRDPIRVCAELSRVARAGYVETPSRIQEQAHGVVGDFVGWSHHRWLVSERAGGIEFVAKPHAIHANPQQQLTAEEAGALTDAERVVALFWEGELPAEERIFTEPDELDAYLEETISTAVAELRSRVRAHTQSQRQSGRRSMGGLRRRR
jgi:hypothetical protein